MGQLVGLIIAIILFNGIAFSVSKNLKPSQIAHIWAFTIAIQLNFDVFVDLKYHGYWYFSKGIDWIAILPHVILIPPVNMVFLNGYPFNSSIWVKIRYMFYWEIFLLAYELTTLLPKPWGYFHYGWWNIGYSVLLNPILLILLLVYYKHFIYEK